MSQSLCPKKQDKKAPQKKQDKKAPHRKVFYTDKELRVTKKWASTDLFGRSTVTLKECHAFLRRNPMAHTPRNIQDKVKQLKEKR